MRVRPIIDPGRWPKEESAVRVETSRRDVLPLFPSPRVPALPEHTKVFRTEAQVAQLVSKVAGQISRVHRGEDLVLVGLAMGALPFLVDLSRDLGRKGIDVKMEIAHAHSYGGDNQQAASVEVVGVEPLAKKHHGRTVIIVDDLADTGRTLKAVKDAFGSAPAQVRTATLLFKPSKHDPAGGLIPDYYGEAIPDRWVLGYGMDHFGGARNLPLIAYYDPPAER
jgi:hypoxanthine phosphoribosyltransferase